MKRTLAFAVICAASLFLLFGCSGEDITAPAPGEDVSQQVTDSGYFVEETVSLDDLKASAPSGAALADNDVAITNFTATPTTVQPGDVLTMNATVANVGTVGSQGPFDVWLGVLGTNFEFARLTLPGLQAGQSRSGAIQFTVPVKKFAKAYPPGVYKLYCTHDFPDSNGANDYLLVNVTLQASTVEADVAVSKTVDNGSPAEGDLVAYTITASNNGPQGASGVEITDILPAGLTIQTATASQGSVAGGVWSVGALGDSLSATLIITALVDSGTGGTTITNTASLTALNETDPNSANDSGSADITVQAPPTGTVLINPEPNAISAPWTLDGPSGQMTGNGDVTLFGQLTGSYTITWEAVAGYDTPAGETLNLNSGQVISFVGTYVQQTSEAFGIWLDTAATQSCTEAAFLSHVAAYIVYSEPSLPSVRGFEASLTLTRAGGSSFNTSVTKTYPVAATDVGNSSGATGIYNFIAGYSEPVPTSANTVMVTLDFFFLEQESVHVALGASDPESPPITGQPAVVKEDFTLLDVGVGNGMLDLLSGGETCAKSTSGASAWNKVRSLYR